MNLRIYLDNNASTVLDPRVREFLIHTLPQLQGNPSSTHSLGQKARNLISKARNSIAAFLHAKPSEIIFTSSGTENANMILRGLVAQKKSHIITSSVEHSCVYTTAKYLA